MHIEVTGRVRVAAPCETAFPLFTPEGERRWVPGWEPEYLHPPGGALAEGLAFRTRHGGEETLWLVSHCDAGAGAVDYVRITPGSRMGTVSVRAAAAGDGTHVEVTYRLTALSADGAARVAGFAEAFPAMLASWERMIADALQPDRRS